MNGLSNLSHPCQCMAGLMTIIEEKGSLENLNITWFGPITNVAHSWIEAYFKNLGFKLSIFSPDRSKDLYLSKISKQINQDRMLTGKLASMDEAAQQIKWINDNPSLLISGSLIDCTGGAIP